MKNINRLFASLILVALFGAAANLSAQTLLWTNRFPLPPDTYFVRSPDYTSGLLHSLQDSLVFANDGLGGSVWIAAFAPISTPGYTTNRVFWINKKGVPIFTNDIPDAVYLVRIVRFTTTELAIQIRPNDGSGENANILRRIKQARGKFTVIDTPLFDREVMPVQAAPKTDKFGFFSYEFPYIPEDYYYTPKNLIIRRYGNR